MCKGKASTTGSPVGFFSPVQPRVPLSQGELSARLAGLILNEVRHQIVAHSNVGSSVAAQLVVVGG